jgi:hypothetical protein
MWKLLVGFIVFAAVALFVLKKSGGDIDMSGEKHDVSGGHAPAAASAPASAPSVAAPAAPASAAASAASS